MDRYPARPILLGALGIFGTILFLMVALSAAGVGLAGLARAAHPRAQAVAIIVACFAVAALFFWLTFLALRASIHRIKEANAAAEARRKALGL